MSPTRCWSILTVPSNSPVRDLTLQVPKSRKSPHSQGNLSQFNVNKKGNHTTTSKSPLSTLPSRTEMKFVIL